MSLIFWTNWTTATHVIILHEPTVIWKSEADVTDQYSKAFSVADRRMNSHITEILYYKFCNEQTEEGEAEVFGLWHVRYLSLTHTHIYARKMTLKASISLKESLCTPQILNLAPKLVSV